MAFLSYSLPFKLVCLRCGHDKSIHDGRKARCRELIFEGFGNEHEPCMCPGYKDPVKPIMDEVKRLRDNGYMV